MNWLWFVLGIVFGIVVLLLFAAIFSAGVAAGKKQQGNAPDIPGDGEVK